MASLKKILSALQGEITAAVGKDRGAIFQATKVVLSLEFEVRENGNGEVSLSFAPPKATLNGASEVPFQKLVLELDLPSSSPSSNPTLRRPGASSQATQELESAQEAELIQGFSSLFGPPGFDSSARATVFREAFGELSPEQSRMLIESFSGTPLPEGEKLAKRSRALLIKICKSGPTKSEEEGGHLLADIFARYPLPMILTLIAREWKTQQSWMG